MSPWVLFSIINLYIFYNIYNISNNLKDAYSDDAIVWWYLSSYFDCMIYDLKSSSRRFL